MQDGLVEAFNKRGFVKDQGGSEGTPAEPLTSPGKDEDVRSRRVACIAELNEAMARVLAKHRMQLDIITTHSHTGTASMISVYPIEAE